MSEDLRATSPQTEASTTGRSYRIYVLVLLTGVYTFNFIDRQIIGILSPAIKEDLGLADWQLGVLKGFAFAVLYTVLGIPIARLADKKNRVTIIAISLALWSGFTAISGAANSFLQLTLARVGVGIGEAGGSPPAHSLISDYFPKESRAGALAIYAMGIPIGVALAYLGGGWVMQEFGWRMAFVAIGLPGIAMAILLKLTVREPERGGLEKTDHSDVFKALRITEPEDGFERTVFGACKIFPANFGGKLASELATIWRAAKHLFSIPTYRAVVIATTAVSFSSYANGGWIVDFYARSHPDFSLLKVLFWLGIISGTAYAAGTFLGGYVVDKLAAKDKRMYGFVPAIALAINAPAFIIAIWVGNPVLSLMFMAPVNLAIGFYLGPCFALAQTLAPVSIRALSTAIFFLVLNMIALGLGPTLAGVLSSALTQSMGEARALQVSLTVISFVSLYGAWMFYQTGKLAPADWAKATGEPIKEG